MGNISSTLAAYSGCYIIHPCAYNNGPLYAATRFVTVNYRTQCLFETFH